jgi:hypothetical protein
MEYICRAHTKGLRSRPSLARFPPPCQGTSRSRQDFLAASCILAL